ncbi:MAG: protease modulator HflC [Candidatus Omnitrophota bacterium]|jgi:membrane protease subunit HflC
MTQNQTAAIIILCSVLGIVALNSLYVVDQTEQVVITQFGEPVGKPVKAPGMHFKTPFIQAVNKFDNRILEWDGYPSEIPTRDKKFIWVDVTGRWRIEDPLLFLRTLHSEKIAQSRIDDIMDGITRNLITRYNIVDVVRSTNTIMSVASSADEITSQADVEKIEVGRDEITRQILDNARQILREYGIEMIDLRIKRINYIQSVQEKVFERMISERKRAAEQMRSEGQGIRAEIEGQKEKDLKKIESEAYLETQKIRGAADAKATAIYGGAYSKDPDFYAFTSTIEKYPATLKGGRLVLTTDSDFVKYLKRADAK